MDLEVFRPNAELEPAWLGGQGRQACGRQGNQVPLHLHALGSRAARQKVHAGAANEPADEGVAGILEELLRAPELKYAPLVHDDHMVREGQSLVLIMGDIDHGRPIALVNLLELATELPFQVRIDHGERLVEKNRRDIGADRKSTRLNSSHVAITYAVFWLKKKRLSYAK